MNPRRDNSLLLWSLLMFLRPFSARVKMRVIVETFDSYVLISIGNLPSTLDWAVHRAVSTCYFISPPSLEKTNQIHLKYIVTRNIRNTWICVVLFWVRNTHFQNYESFFRKKKKHDTPWKHLSFDYFWLNSNRLYTRQRDGGTRECTVFS